MRNLLFAAVAVALFAVSEARACNGSQALFQPSAVVSQPFLVQQSAFVVQPSFIVQPTNTVLLTGGGFFGGTSFVGGGFGGNSLFIGGGRRNNSLFIGGGAGVGGGSLFVNERRGLFGGLRERTVIQNGAGGSSFFQQRRGRR